MYRRTAGSSPARCALVLAIGRVYAGAIGDRTEAQILPVFILPSKNSFDQSGFNISSEMTTEKI